MAKQLNLFAIPEFPWHLTISGVRYDFIMAESKDDSPWVGAASVDGVEVCWSVIEQALRDRWDMTLEQAEAWIEEALQGRLDFERAGSSVPS